MLRSSPPDVLDTREIRLRVDVNSWLPAFCSSDIGFDAECSTTSSVPRRSAFSFSMRQR